MADSSKDSPKHSRTSAVPYTVSVKGKMSRHSITSLTNHRCRPGDPPRYIYEMPFQDYRDLCRLLDADKKWEELAAQMGMDWVDIKLFGEARMSHRSPADEVLKKFGDRNGKISTVFCHLCRIGYIRGARMIQKYVDVKYWCMLEACDDEHSSVRYLRTPTAPSYHTEISDLNFTPGKPTISSAGMSTSKSRRSINCRQAVVAAPLAGCSCAAAKKGHTSHTSCKRQQHVGSSECTAAGIDGGSASHVNFGDNKTACGEKPASAGKHQPPPSNIDQVSCQSLDRLRGLR